MEVIIQKLIGTDPVQSKLLLVYCPPKVGSTTVVSSTRLSASDKYLVIHLHDDSVLRYFDKDVDKKIYESEVESEIIHKPLMIKFIEEVSKIFTKVIVLDIYRNPLEQMISNYFENLQKLHFNNTEDNISNYSVSLLIRRFNNIFPHILCEDYYRTKYGFNLDELQNNFNYINNYIRVIKENVEYVKIRMNDSENWGSILTEILNVPITIFKDYETKNRPIKTIYETFKMEYKLPCNYVEILTELPDINNYMNEPEKLEYIEYLNNISSPEIWEPYTKHEYDLYISISLENQIYGCIQYHHYKDDGCLCIACKNQRNIVLSKIRSNECQDNLRINHDISSKIPIPICVPIQRKIKRVPKVSLSNVPKVFSSRSFSIPSVFTNKISINGIGMNIKK